MFSGIPQNLRWLVLPTALFIAAVGLSLGAFALAAVPAGWAAALGLVGAGSACGLGWQARRRLQLERALAEAQAEARHAAARLHEVVKESAETAHRLDLVLRFNRRLVQAQDERALMNSALGMINELTGALGCSFVPVDEWEQPLPPYTCGDLPEPVLSAWAAHLSGAMLRERCGACTVLRSTPGGCPLHPQVVGDSLRVYCLPLVGQEVAVNGGESLARRLGVLNLYLPAGRELDGETQIFLEGLLQELALLVAAVRRREQEITTLRQIQMLHAPEGSLQESLSGLLEGLRQALDADFVFLRLRPSSDDRISGLNVQVGQALPLPDAAIEAIFARVLQGENERSQPGDLPAWLALPMRLPEGQIPGMLMAGSTAWQGLPARQEAILQTVAAQAALLVENERLLRSLEYKAVIAERSRLAREIHDGLAQTLAFLKLQAAQMQSYLDKGDLARLSQVLKDNYQTLAEAYLDTRQAIDNLRLTPREGLEAWLERTLADFEAVHGVAVERHIHAIAPGWNAVLSPEVQAQLIRIVQEALNNVRKHARATRVIVSLVEREGDLVLEIRDNGRGFDPEDVPEISQHGLRGIRERAEFIGADFQIISQSRQGTVVRLVLPAYLKEGAR